MTCKCPSLRVVTTLVALLVASLLWADNAHASGAAGRGRSTIWGSGQLDPIAVIVGVGKAGGARTPSTTVPSSQGQVYYWNDYPCPQCIYIVGLVCDSLGRLINVPSPVRQLGPGQTVPIYAQLIGPRGVIGDPVLTCTVRRPPPPPNPEQVWASAPLPLPDIEFNPARIGLTQLATWFWLSNDGGLVTLSVELAGYYVSLAVRPISYHWDFGDGSSTDSSTSGSPGGALEASAVHTYVEPGTYNVGVTVTWAGDYTFTGYGVDETLSLGPVNQPEVFRLYTVQQVRGVLVPPNTSS
jgi:hypothetical protein